MTVRTAAHQIDYRKGGLERAEHDWYVDPACATEALLRVERFEGLCYDPACGQGTIPKTLRAHGLTAIGSDIVDRGFGTPGIDFLTAEMPTVSNILANPPYRTIPNPAGGGSVTMAELFIDKALAITTRKVAVLVRLAFLESTRRTQRFTTDWPIARVWVFGWRISMPPGGQGIEAKGGVTAFCWCVFEHGRPAGQRPEIGWLVK